MSNFKYKYNFKLINVQCILQYTLSIYFNIKNTINILSINYNK